MPSDLLRFIGEAELQTETLRGAELGVQFTQQAFRGARWTFYPDGKFVFIPHQTNNSHPNIFFIPGTYSEVGNTLEFQGERLGSGSGISVDGTVRMDGVNILLDAIYSISVCRKAQQIAKISQPLSRRPETSISQSEIDVETRINFPDLTPPDGIQAALALPNPRYRVIEGIQVPYFFEIYLEGKTESQPFGPLLGTLYIHLTKFGDPSSLSIMLLTTSKITNGTVRWSPERDEQGKLDIEIQVRSGQVHMELKPSECRQSLHWYTLPKGDSSSGKTAFAFAENATLTFSIQGDRLSGEIYASGLYSSGSNYNQPTTYKARITGERKKSDWAEDLRTMLSTSSFNGRWDTGESAFGQIDELKQNGQEVSGTYTGHGRGTIKGTVRGNRLDFTWEDNQRGKGWGFFRAIAGGGTLTGLWGNRKDKTDGQILIAAWKLPPPSTQTFTPAEDMEELRYLGADLTDAGRCEQAVEVLEKVLTLHQEKRHKEGIDDLVGDSDLSSEAVMLSQIINGCFQIGNYEKLLGSLDYALKIQSLLTPGESSRRSFRYLTEDLSSELSHYSNLSEIYQTTLAILQGNISYTGVGLRTEQNKETKEVSIVFLTENAPASRAGILLQDVIVKIDGQSIQGMDNDGVSERLRGPEGTQVTLTVRRENAQLDVRLTRTRIELRPMHRQASEIAKYLQVLFNYLESFQARLDDDLNRIKTLKERVAKEQEEPVQAVESLFDNFGNQQARLVTETDEVIARGKELFKEQEELLRVWETGLEMGGFKEVCQVRSADSNPKEIAALEERFYNSLQSNSELTELEKQLFALQSNILLKLLFLSSLYLDGKLVFIKKMNLKERFEENLKRSREVSSRLGNNLENWRKRLITDVDKINALDRGQPFFQKLVKFLIELGDEEEALVASEKSRARAFADLLTKRIASNSAFKAAADSPTLEKIQQIAQAQKATIVEYFINNDSGQESNLFTWIINPTGEIYFRSVDLKPLLQQQTSLSDLVIKAREYLVIKNDNESVVRDATPHTRAENPRSINDISDEPLKQLYQYLIQKIAKFLPTDSNSPVIFIPQGKLFLVPFSSLKDPTGEFLIKRHTILTAPSIQLLEFTRQQQSCGEKETSLNALVVGNPNMPAKSGPSLPASELAANVISNHFCTKAVIGAKATKAGIMQQLHKVQLIHLGTHAKFDEEQPLQSYIALASSNDDNGYLTAGEILERYGSPQGVPLQAKLVVLDGCSTGRGKITGDGVNGLSRCLMAAGVPCLIVSLWEVQDWPTAFLMIKFYKEYLQADDSVTKALKSAQEWLRNVTTEELWQWMQKEKLPLKRMQRQELEKWLNQEKDKGNTKPFQHPYYWAAFCGIGQ